ncbi:hypothetical protein MUTS15_44630 [Escherichia coli]|nr:hypothetical protein MUTS15_44630 [Escherichia coli]BDZ04369.1 hypothetical protein MUTS16_54420 [Escherichia coli]
MRLPAFRLSARALPAQTSNPAPGGWFFAKQKLAATVLDNKVERDKRSGAHYRGKVFLT